jgi:hypothetical protein
MTWQMRPSGPSGCWMLIFGDSSPCLIQGLADTFR